MRDWPDRPRDLTRWILDQRGVRGARGELDVRRAYGAFVEQEPDFRGRLRNVATLLLTNRECSFRCLMCDLWRSTLEQDTPPGAIPEQIRAALSSLPAAQVIKLYNAGSFFDRRAMPPGDWPAIAQAVAGFERVVVESHPRLVGRSAPRLRDLLHGRLEVAVGLETAHPGVLERLNKNMTVADFEESVRRLREWGIDVRTFILLRPPFMTEREGIDWARRSLDFAFSVGVQCCCVVPARAGNGALDRLRDRGLFAPPSLPALEEVHAYGLGLRHGRVFVDLWDVDRMTHCTACFADRVRRLRGMNLTQSIPPKVACDCEVQS